MTQNQIAYKQAQIAERRAIEEERSNRAKEAETKRSNLEKEFQEYGMRASGHAKDAHWAQYRPDDTTYGSDRLQSEVAQAAEQVGDVMGNVFPFKIRIGGK